MVDSFSSLSFLSKDCSDLRARLRQALAERRSALAASIVSGDGSVEIAISRAFLHLRTILSFFRIIGDIFCLVDFDVERFKDLLVEFAANTSNE